MERTTRDALQAAGDHGSAFMWRRICRDLEGPLRVGIAAKDPGVALRLMKVLGADSPGNTEWVSIRAETTLGAQDRLLGVHVLIWATPITAALGAGERDLLETFEHSGAPTERALVLADGHLLERLSDDPLREGREVRERLTALRPDGWDQVEEAKVLSWLDSLRADLGDLTRTRKRDVSRLLLEDTFSRSRDAVTQCQAELEKIQALLHAEDSALADARHQGQRAAAHMLAAMRRHTEQLLVDLRDFLLVLERDLPEQVAAVAEVDQVRTSLAHWLHHVVERWMSERLADWRIGVLKDLKEVHLTEADVTRAELLVPALHPSTLRGEANWGRRLGATAAMGGGAALLLFGMWIPGVIALGSGIVFSALGSGSKEAATRKKLIETAIEALRRMGVDAERLLSDQITQLEEQLAQLGEDRVAAEEAEQEPRRAELAEHGQRYARRLDELSSIRDALATHLSQASA
jgi:hypothetical protein